MASRCCKCMSSGICVACSCAHQHTPCSNCYPSRVDRCRDLARHSNTSWTLSISDSEDDSEVHKGDCHIVSCVATAPCAQPSSVSISSQPVITLSSSPQSPQVVELPSFHLLSNLHFQWNDFSGDECVELVSR